jgi:protease-4
MSKVVYRRSRRPGCFTILFAIVAIGFFLLWLHDRHMGRHIQNGSENGQDGLYGQDAYPPFSEIWSEGHGENKVVRIPISGMILLGQDPSIFGGLNTTDLALQSIKRATLDPDVKALIIEVDSGGGGITASDIIYHHLMQFKAHDPTRKVVVICGDMAASGAYYISLAADRILAHPTTLTGSIGVIIQSINIKELAEEYGIRDITIKSGENKDLLNPFGDMPEEQLALLQHVVDDMHGRFVGLVAESRGIELQTVEALADGRIYTASQALEYGLIDGIGYWQDAISVTKELLNVQDIIIYRYEPSFSWRQLLRASTQLTPRAWLDAIQTPRLRYQWKIN